MTEESEKNESRPVEYRVPDEKLAQFKKDNPNIRLVEFEVKDDEGNVTEIHEFLFHKPGPLVAKNYWNTAAGGDVYGAVKTLVVGTLIFPAQSEAVRLMDECPDLAFDLNNELRSFIQRVGKVSSKKV